MWVSQVTFPAPGKNDLLDVIADAIAGLGDGHEVHIYGLAGHPGSGGVDGLQIRCLGQSR